MYVAIVDDHAGLREAISALLEVAGFPSRGFESAEAFMHSQEMGDAACLILDERLPGGIDGLELQRQLAESGVQVPIVFISAHEDRDPRVPARALHQGALAFFRKPFSDEELLSAVDRAWQAGGGGYTKV
jgi:FixJ family two-component response regulator